MDSSNILRWLRYLVWVAGFFTVWCPVCICLSGSAAWLVCATTIGLTSIVIVSSYTTWTVFHHFLNKGKPLENFFTRYIFTSNIKNNEDVFLNDCKFLDPSVLEKEISSTAQTFYLHLILPWYSYISPDEKYALQIKSALEDLLTGISRSLQLNTNAMEVVQEILQLYIQSYRNFYKALKKVSQKFKRNPISCIKEKEAIESSYKPLHESLRTTNGIDKHFQKLAHLLLYKYLPSEVSKCSFIFVSLREYFSQKFLKYIFDQFSDTQWLNRTLHCYFICDHKFSNICEAETQPQDQTSVINGQSHSTNVGEIDKDTALSYTHCLSAIREETSFEMYDVERTPIGLKIGNFISQNSKIISNLNGKTKQVEVEFSNISGFETKNNTNETEDCDLEESNTVLSDPNCIIDSKSFSEIEEPIMLDIKKVVNPIELIKYVNCSNTKDQSGEFEECDKSVKSALGGFISATAMPLLPDMTSFPGIRMQSIPRKMWQSPVEEREFLSEVAPKQKKNLFQKHIIDGIKEDDFNRIYKKFQDTNFRELKQILKSVNINEKFAQSSGNQIGLCTDEKLIKLFKCRSLDNLTLSPPPDFSFGIPLIKHSLSSDCIVSLKCSKNCSNNSLFGSSCRKDKKLEKMNSFDKNDGTDMFSLQSNGILSSPIKTDLSESNCKELAAQIDVDQHQNLPKIINTSSQANLDVLQCETQSTSMFTIPASPEIESPNFGWENPDLSPIYEESENLASTIAKLRCLLSERQSQHSLGSQSSFGSSESEPKSAQSDPGRYSLEKSKFTFYHKDSTGSLASVKSTSSTDSYCPMMTEEDLLEATEIPIDGRVFTYISIPATEVQTEVSGLQYTMYIIQYDAIYICEAVSTSTSNKDEMTLQTLEPKVVLQTNFVKRRFREFLSLHSALEDDSQLRLSMKGVKGPNKWLNLPFSKLDSATISSRKQFLEKYLQALVQKPSINVSFPLKEFLAYGSSDSSIAFSKKHLEINVPRLDKILARTVSGVFQSLKTALPNFDSVESLDVTSNCGLPSSSLSQPQPTYLEDGTLDTAACDKRQYLEITMPIRKTFEVQLDITADEQICEMEKTLLAAVTSSQLNSPNESSENLEMKLSPVPSLVFSFKSASSSSLSETLETASKKQFIRDLDLQMIREESTEDANLGGECLHMLIFIATRDQTNL